MNSAGANTAKATMARPIEERRTPALTASARPESPRFCPSFSTATMLPAYRSRTRDFGKRKSVFVRVRALLCLLAAVFLFATRSVAQQSTPVTPQATPVQSAPAARIQAFTPAPAARSTATQADPTSATRRLAAKLNVNANAADWTDTGLPVVGGDTLTFSARGQISLGGHLLTPDGAVRGWRDMLRRFPVDAANAGALVGRIGDSAATVPFTVGTNSMMTAAQSGTLFLRTNTSSEAPATGNVRVEVSIAPATTRARDAGLLASLPAMNVFAAMSPATLDALPPRVVDRDGNLGDPVNFALVGTEQQVRDAFRRAGWVQVDADASAALVHGLLNTLEHKPYVEVPMSTLYLFGRPQDLSFARASAITVATERHHLRCWNSGVTVNGAPLWIGAATHDIGLERDQRNGQITHRIAPEIDLERDFLRDTLLESGMAAAVAYFTPLHAVRSARTATGGSFSTDGRVLLIQLR